MADSVKMQISLPSAALEKLKELCADSGVSKSAVIAIAIAEKYEREKGGGQA